MSGIHKQDNNYLTTQQLTDHRFTLSKDDKQTDHIIDRQTIQDIDLPNNLKHFKDRMKQTIQIRETLTGSI